MTRRPRSLRRAFSLIELLVVIAIIAVLLGLLLAAVQKVRASAARTQCQNNLKQITLATHSYHDAHRVLPVNSLKGDFGPLTPAWSWLARILPYIEQDALYKQGGLPERTLYDARDVVATSVRVFLCPSDSANQARADAADLGIWTTQPIPAAPGNYRGVSGSNWGWGDPKWRNQSATGSWDGLNEGDGIFFRADWKSPKTLHSISDGTSSTFLVGEDLPSANHWFAWAYANSASATCAIPPNVKYPTDTDYSWKWEFALVFRSRHAGGLHFGYADGSVRFVSDTIDLTVYRALSTIRGGESVNYP